MSTATEAATSAFTVSQFPCRSDNYGYLLHDQSTGQTAAIDTPCGRSYNEELERRGWKLTHILNTHHHHDHTGANLELKTEGVTIIGPRKEKHKIPGIDLPVGEGDKLKFGNHEIIVMDGGGHTKGHVIFYFPGESSVFVGDCLFSLGCGKMFEGNPAQFWRSLETLRDLPDDTMVYW
jgi:hydroxyacylglutathione hydrolase